MGAAQCGFCIPGFVVSTKALLDSNPHPTREEVRAWFTQHHNACRCTGYKPIVDAVMDAAAVLRGEMPRSALEFKMPTDGQHLGQQVPTANRGRQGHRYARLRPGSGPEDAARHAATGAGPGEGLARQHPVD